MTNIHAKQYVPGPFLVEHSKNFALFHSQALLGVFSELAFNPFIHGSISPAEKRFPTIPKLRKILNRHKKATFFLIQAPAERLEKSKRQFNSQSRRLY